MLGDLEKGRTVVVDVLAVSSSSSLKMAGGEDLKVNLK